MAVNEIYKLSGKLEGAIGEVDSLLASGGKDLNLDFQDVTFITVEGLEWLEELLLHADSASRKVTFSKVPPAIYKVFKIAHIDSLLKASGAPVSRGPAC